MIDIRRQIHGLAEFLTKSSVFILLAGMAFFAYQNAGFQRDNGIILHNTQQTVDNLKKLLCEEGMPPEQCAIVNAVEDLKADNARQTLIIQCLLVVHGETQFVTDEAAQACQVIQDQAFSGTISGESSNPPVSPTNPPTHSHEDDQSTDGSNDDTGVNVDKVLPDCRLDILFVHIGC